MANGFGVEQNGFSHKNSGVIMMFAPRVSVQPQKSRIDCGKTVDVRGRWDFLRPKMDMTYQFARPKKTTKGG